MKEVNEYRFGNESFKFVSSHGTQSITFEINKKILLEKAYPKFM